MADQRWSNLTCGIVFAPPFFSFPHLLSVFRFGHVRVLRISSDLLVLVSLQVGEYEETIGTCLVFSESGESVLFLITQHIYLKELGILILEKK